MISFNHEDLVGELFMTTSQTCFFFKSIESEKVPTERSS